jgi:hypothetical protein
MKEFRQESEQRIEELEADMEKILMETKESDDSNKRKHQENENAISNWKKDLKHYQDLYQKSENN